MLSLHIARVTVSLDVTRLLILLACLAVALVAGTGVVRAIAKRRTLPLPNSMPPFAVLSFITHSPQSTIAEAIARYATQAGLSIISRQGDDFLVLSEPANITRFGRYYPIYLRDYPGIGTRVEVGMLSQLTQAPLVASKRLRRRVAGILSALEPSF